MWNIEGRKSMQLLINIVQPIENHLDAWDDWVDAFDLLGAKAEDYNPDTQVVTLEVDAGDIEADYEIHGGMYPHEIWGAIQMVEEYEITVKTCKWQNYHILNDEDVCAAIEERY
jgi:hypothetical protein